MPRTYGVTSPRYRVEYACSGNEGHNYYFTPAVWHIRTQFGGNIAGYGRPTDANLLRWVRTFEASTQPGGPNAHIGVTVVTRAFIVNNITNRAVAWYDRPYYDSPDDDDSILREQESNFQRGTK